MNTRYDLITAPFSGTIDLAAAKIGGQALLANDEFFAGKENLLEPGRGVWIDGKFTDRGKWMDGWESRRKRVPGHDWCIIKLGAPGLIKGVDIDTNNFLGNHPPFASVDALCVSGEETPEDLANRQDWVRILPKSPLREGSQNIFSVETANTYSHLRLNIYPDGGVARFRVYGIVKPEEQVNKDATVDLASVLAGATVPAASDMFFGNKEQLLHPGRGRNMGDGWETRRRRGPGHDWSIITLGQEGILKEILVDTAHFKGNYPDRCSLEGIYLPRADRYELDYPTLPWRPVFAETKLQADAEHRFSDFQDSGPFSHLRLRIYPDGGVSRLRAYSLPLVHNAAKPGIAANNNCSNALAAKSAAERKGSLLSCISSPAWADMVLAQFPYANDSGLFRAAIDYWYALSQSDWLSAFSAHPRIGDKEVLRARLASREANEQSGMSDLSDAELDDFVALNRAYEDKFGFIFLICASGKSASELKTALKARLSNQRPLELAIAAREQAEIALLRLAKLGDCHA